MNKAFIMSSVIAISAAACGPQLAGTGAANTATDTPVVTVPLPEGDVEAGRQAFLDLRCTACHAVPSEPEFPPPVGALGPTIDARVAGSDMSYLATAIVAPSHQLSVATPKDVRTSLVGVLSPMGDFSRSMTVRQLIDLHAYLRSIQ